ncbi:MAG: creatininase family protein [Candidatus Hodarchaeota archaeon]
MDPLAHKYRYEWMRLDKIASIIEHCPVAIQPSGLLEWHGRHNAIGLDGVKGYYICERAITLLGDGVLMPMNWVGTYGFIRYPGTICYDANTTYMVFLQIYKELMKLGFKVIFVLTGHYGQWQMTHLAKARAEAEDWAKTKGLKVRLLGMHPPTLVPYIFGGDHAQRYETSMLWRVGEAYGIDLVDVSDTAVGVEHVPMFKIDDEGVPIREPEEWKWVDNLKDPDVCSTKFGEYLIDSISKGMVLEILEMLGELGIDYLPPSPILEPGF